LFDKQEFWNLVNKYPKQIKQVTFNLISPNLANISKNLKLDMRELYEDTNTQKTKVELNSEEDSYLDIKESSKFVNRLVDYSSEDGGNIQMRVAGMRKLIHTAQSPSEFNVEEQLLKSCDWDKRDELFKDILIEKLNYSVTENEEGIQLLKKKYSEYLPESIINENN
jgi:hypothetical protein